MYSLEKRPQSLFSAASCAFSFVLLLTGGLLNSGNLFFGRGCVIGVVHLSSLWVTNSVYCSSPRVIILLTASATWVSTMSLVSMTKRSWLCSRNGFPISSSTVTSALTSFRNAVCTPGCCSWCLESLSPCFWFVACSSNSLVILAISGPATIQRLSAPGFPVSPIAPPEPLTMALFCSWHWSSAMAENWLLVLCTTKCPDMNSARTAGCLSARVIISRMCTESHLL